MSIASACCGSPQTAPVIARSVACLMLIWSITLASQARHETTALSRIDFRHSRRSVLVSFLESFRPQGIFAGSRMTAAATTGPANGPRPASSTPAIRRCPFARKYSSQAKSGTRCLERSREKGRESAPGLWSMRRFRPEPRFPSRPETLISAASVAGKYRSEQC